MRSSEVVGVLRGLAEHDRYYNNVVCDIDWKKENDKEHYNHIMANWENKFDTVEDIKDYFEG